MAPAPSGAVASPTTPTTPSPSAPTPNAPSPSATEQPHRGLTISTTVGVGVGVAVIAIIIFIAGFICVRRRRKIWGKKRKAQGEPKIEGETPDEEISKKVKGDSEDTSVKAAELADGEVKSGNVGELAAADVKRAELVGSEGTGDMKAYGQGGEVQELAANGGDVQELAAQENPVELGGGHVIAELDGTCVEQKKEDEQPEPQDIPRVKVSSPEEEKK